MAVLETASCGACGICVCNAAWLRAGPAPHSDVAQAKAKLVREVGMCFCWWGMLLSVSLGCVMFSQLHLNTPSWQHLLITSDGSCLCSGACLHASSALKAGYRCCLQLCLDQRDTTGHLRGRSLLDHENIQGVCCMACCRAVHFWTVLWLNPLLCTFWYKLLRQAFQKYCLGPNWPHSGLHAT